MSDLKQVSTAEVIDIIVESMNTQEQLTPQSMLADQKDWDSMAVLMLMAALDENLGMMLRDEEIQEFTTVQDIIDFIASRGHLAD